MWQLLNRKWLACGRHRGVAPTALCSHVQVRQHETPAFPNRLNQQFALSSKNWVWAGDRTFVPTHTGWLLVAVLLDLYSRRIVGWAMSPHQTLSVVVETW